MLPNPRLIVPLTAVNAAALPPPSSDGIVILNPAVYPVPESVTVADVITPLATTYVPLATPSAETLTLPPSSGKF